MVANLHALLHQIMRSLLIAFALSRLKPLIGASPTLFDHQNCRAKRTKPIFNKRTLIQP